MLSEIQIFESDCNETTTYCSRRWEEEKRKEEGPERKREEERKRKRERGEDVHICIYNGEGIEKKTRALEDKRHQRKETDNDKARKHEASGKDEA